MAEEGADRRALARLVGERVHRLRTARGWSLSALAGRTGLGKATLSELEAGRRNPTLETLYAIAASLQIGLAELLVEPGAGPQEAPIVHGRAVDAVLVATYRDPTVTTEVYRLHVRPGPTQISPHHGPGVTEHLLVTRGAVRVGPVDGPTTVRAGADWSWQPTGPHSYAAVGDEPAEAVLLMRHPRAGAS